MSERSASFYQNYFSGRSSIGGGQFGKGSTELKQLSPQIGDLADESALRGRQAATPHKMVGAKKPRRQRSRKPRKSKKMEKTAIQLGFGSRKRRQRRPATRKKRKRAAPKKRYSFFH